MANVYVLPDQRLVECRAGESVLDAALRVGIDWAHACGGHASCSTCRLAVVEGMPACTGRTAKEERIAERLGFGPEFRLACQVKLAGDATVRRLVLDDEDAELADVRPCFARSEPPAPVRWLFGGVVRRRSRPRPIGVEKEVAVLFADIRGFTAFSDSQLAYDVIHALERHLRDATRIVEGHGGVVTAYLGDGLMALFGVEERDGAALSAVRAGLALVRASDDRRPVLEGLYGRAFQVDVGVHFGHAVVGALWGEPGRVTAIGDTVNVASRIEQANKEHATRLLVSEAVVAEAGDGALDIGRTERCVLPGKAGEHTLHEVLGVRPEVDHAPSRTG